ncbi:MAG: hypothetical protein AAFQ89_14000 [Cyanobacteria bacterium J06626_18]
MNSAPRASDVNEWFPPACQDRYVEKIVGQSGLTRRQAICFVRLWGYAYLQLANQRPPIQALDRCSSTFVCSHREAADLFYCDRSRGSGRSAGMMVDQLIAKHLIKREPTDGGPTRLSLQILDSFLPSTAHIHSTQLYPDAFNVREDTSPVSTFLEENYSWVSGRSQTTSFKITQVLRQWATQCPDGLRVLRTASDNEPVGFAALFPTHPDSEEQFHLPPSASLHLSTLDKTDPLRVALPGDDQCYAVFVRSWQIRPLYWNYSTTCQFLQDSQTTLRKMQASFPNLCDLYTIAIHPRLEALAFAVGFKPLKTDPNSSLRWLHLSLDRFLATDIETALVEFDFTHV